MNPRKARIKQLEKEAEKFSTYLDKLKKLSLKVSTFRLILFITGLVAFLLLFFFVPAIYAYLSALIFIIAFGITVMEHNKIDFEIRRTISAIKFKKENIARININWADIPYEKEILPDNHHPFESDLNISGKYSLHHLINICTSSEGSELLRSWLTIKEPDFESTIRRQKLVKELLPLVRFREKLHLNGSITSKYKTHAKNLYEVLKPKTGLAVFKKILIVLSAVIIINIILFLWFFYAGVPAYFTIGLLIQLGIYWFNSKHISQLFDNAIDIKDELGKFSRVLDFLESYHYKENSELKKFCEPFLKSNFKPSEKFKEINRVIIAASMQKNPLTELLFNLIFPWDYYYAFKLEKLKQQVSENLSVWFNTWYQLEALNSLANLAYINPDYIFPDLYKNQQDEELTFTAEETGHPLIHFEKNVTNSFRFTGIGESVIITGSNMSGKSTFLKTLGLNLALAYAGGPVYAKTFSTRLFRIFTCINISDSVNDGISYFYAEVKRLKELLKELQLDKPVPVFYLIDEIFRGTNNLERLIGSRSFIKELAGSNSIGFISTHDLELVRLEDEIKNIINYHFREEIEDKKMKFDYKIRKGPCPTTNALKIMELEGLPVER